jgi:sigma-B regulation protein RsbU (phosphoserine phosphatase)
VPADGEQFDHWLTEESLIIGRSSSAGLALPDRYLSRQHSRIFRDQGKVFLEDLGSRNGTLLNGELVESPRALKAGDVVKVSGSVITLHTGGPPTASRASSASGLGRSVFRRASDLIEVGPRRTGTTGSGAGTAALERYAERLKLLHEVHGALAQPISLADLLEMILDRAFDHLRPERAAIFLKGPQGELVRAASRSATAGEGFLDSQRLSDEVIEKGLAALVVDAQTDERFAGAQSILSSGVRSLIAAPLQTPDGVLGMIALDSRIQVRQFEDGDLELLAGLAAVAALRIRNVALAEEAAERRRMEEELALARRIQVALLPAHVPEIPGFEIRGGNVPSRGVSGDYYEVLERAEGRECVLLVADVSGKGIAASLLTASIEALSASPIEDGLAPDEIFTRLSRQLYRRTPPEKYATAFAAVVEADDGRLLYANAGHNPALLVRAGGEVQTLGATGPPVGLLPTAAYRVDENRLAPGDLLVLYTDGIVEAVDPDDEEYGLDRLTAVLLEHRAADLVELTDAVDNDLAAFVRGVPYADDRTIVVIRRRPS